MFEMDSLNGWDGLIDGWMDGKQKKNLALLNFFLKSVTLGVFLIFENV